ncbi:MAG: PEP-CTERM sorting domain-containing protein [Crocosphaera sp.]
MWSNIGINTWTVSNGEITNGVFVAIAGNGNDQLVLDFNTNGVFNVSLDGFDTFVVAEYDSGSGEFPTASITPVQAESVPEPGSLVALLGLGLGFVAAKGKKQA